MAIVSFNKNFVISEKEAVSKLIEVLLSGQVKPIHRELASAEVMARGEELLIKSLSRSNDLWSG
jgi:hypothetical protein